VRYRSCIRPLLFRYDSERVHHLMLAAGRLPGAAAAARVWWGREDDPRLSVHLFGLNFPNPIGLAAGFDKNCDIVPLCEALGFGAIEVGSITAKAQSGNPRPRIFRFPEDEALINRMGFPSAGADAVAPRFAAAARQRRAVLGVNIGKSKVAPIDDALADYLYTFRLVREAASYFVLNVSSPNTPDLRKLQERARLTALLQGIQGENHGRKPLLLKIAPDLTWPEVDDVLQCCADAGVAGLIATNTTFSREGLAVPTAESGGMSGRPLKPRSLAMVRYVVERMGRSLPVIGVGGIFTAADVIAYLEAGARLVQVYTGLVYEGPGMVSRMKVELSRHLTDRGLSDISEIRPKYL